MDDSPPLQADPGAPVADVAELLKQMKKNGGLPRCVECGTPTTGAKTGLDGERIPLCKDCCFQGAPANRAERRARRRGRRR